MRQAISILAAMGIASAAFAQPDNEIIQHNVRLTQGVHYNILQAERVIFVYEGIPGEEFMFEAVQKLNGQYVGPGDIDGVYDWSEQPEIVLTFVGHDGHPHGAANIKEINLAHGYAVIEELNISGDLGEYGPIVADAAGSLTVGGNLRNYVWIAGDITGSLTVAGDVVHDIQVGGAIAGPVTIGRDLCTYEYGDKLSCASLGGLSVGRDVVGDIEVEGANADPPGLDFPAIA